MAKKALRTYTFTPGGANTGTVVVDGYWPLESFLLITNTTTQAIIYNFADTTSGGSVSYDSTTNKTTLTLELSTTGQSSTDKLQIFVDDNRGLEIIPTEPLYDPVNKFRVSQPQALIDTDFEYGPQTTKWENLALVNYRPFAYQTEVGIGTINYIQFLQNSDTVTVGLVTTCPIGVGSVVSILDSLLPQANGNYVIDTITGIANTIFTYTAKSVNTSSIINNIFDSNKTGIFTGTLYANAPIGSVVGYQTSNSGILTVTTSIPHGLAIGNRVALTQSTDGILQPPNGAYSVVGIPSATAFGIQLTRSSPSPQVTGGRAFVLPQGQVTHRPFDGGVTFSTNATGNFEQIIRQTRRYFRYQSGKGIQVSSGTILEPNLQVDVITAAGTVITVRTKEQHNILPGTEVTIGGCNQTAYNGTFIVTDIIGPRIFRYTALATPSSSPATGLPYVAVSAWHGAVSRLGIFDEQNGIFFEYDGQKLYAVRRNSTFQLAGKFTVTNGSNTVTVTNGTDFPSFLSSQLVIGDFIVIRGQSYRVIDIASDSSLTISPAYRGANATYVNVSKTQDLKIPQSDWNIDKCNGTGPSGYTLNLSKMQMFYIDYSWYGAGFIRWGFRGTDGNVFYVHKLINNNVNSEAYMRSGNLPARYESQTIPPTTQINKSVTALDNFVGVASTAGFPLSGTLVIRDANVYEYVNYTGIGTTAFTGLKRARGSTTSTLAINVNSNTVTGINSNALQIGQRVIHELLPPGTFITGFSAGNVAILSNAFTGTLVSTAVTFVPMGVSTAQAFTYSATNPVAVELAYPTFAPTVSHWGTSVIMDGRFDDDKSLVFTFGQSSSTSVPANSSRALFSIRVAPSVDNGQVGVFGARELINRMQLTLRALDITTSTSNANLLVTGVLNGIPSTSTTWTNAVGNVVGARNSSLAQIANYAGGSATISGGETIAGFFVGTGANSIDLTSVRDLGNSILGGGGLTSREQIYPDGPDTLTIVVTNLSGSTAATVFGRLSWTEAQA